MNLKPALCLHILLICGASAALAQTPAKPVPHPASQTSSSVKAQTAPAAPAKPSAPGKSQIAIPAKPVSTKVDAAGPATAVKANTGTQAKTTVASDSKTTSTKALVDPKAKASDKTDKQTAKSTAKSKTHKASSSGGFVPPPPPSTPSFLADPAGLSLYYGSAMPLEFLSKENLKERDKEITMQLTDAQKEFANKKRSVDERRDRAVNFESLFQEGVISRRELENAQNEASDSGSEILRLESKVAELQNLKDRINKRLQATNPQSKSQKRKLIH